MDDFTFGFNPLDTNRCLPPETLHQLNQGVFKKLLDYFNDCITSKGLGVLDTMAKYLANDYHRQSSKKYPNIHIFKDGLDKCQLTGTEIVFKVFILYLVMIQTYTLTQLPLVEQKVSQCYKKKKKVVIDDNQETEEEKDSYPKICKSLVHTMGWIKLLEFTLCLDTWVGQSKIDNNETLNKDLHSNYKESKGQIIMWWYMKLYIMLIKDQ